MTAPDVDVEVHATVTDRWDATETVYVGSMPAWAWSDPGHTRQWKTMHRRLILEDRTSDPRGWRVVFSSREVTR